MNAHGLMVCLSLNKRIFDQLFKSVMKGKRCIDKLEVGAKILCALEHDFLWDCISMKEGQKTEQVSAGRIGSLDFLKRNRPGRRHRLSISHRLSAAAFQERSVLLLVQVQVFGEAAMCFIDIRSSLVKG